MSSEEFCRVPKLAALIAGAAAALSLAACSSAPTASTEAAPSLSQSMANASGSFAQAGAGGATTASGAPAPGTPGASAFDPADDCPPVEVRAGSSTLTLNSSGRDPSAIGLRYQGNISQTARECTAFGGNLTIKVGVQARLIVGPAGGPGKVDLPLRYALVQEGIEPKTVWTKLYKIPAEIAEGQPNATVTHVETDLTVPLPHPDVLAAYVVYVGFDPLGATAQDRKKPARQRAR